MLSSYLALAADGGLLGIEQRLPEIDSEVMDSRMLDKIER